MKGGGGLTWVGWLGIGIGSMLVYAGMTGQSLIGELAGVLSGRKAAPATVPSLGAAPAGSYNAQAIAAIKEREAAASRAIPYPVLGAHTIGSKAGEL